MSRLVPLTAKKTAVNCDEIEWIQAARIDSAQFRRLYLRWITPVYQYLIFRVQDAARKSLTRLLTRLQNTLDASHE